MTNAEKSTSSSESNQNLTLIKKSADKVRIPEILLKNEKSFNEGAWIGLENLPNLSPENFVKILNKYLNYELGSKNHIFTYILYIPELGYALIDFLNEQSKKHFIYESLRVEKSLQRKFEKSVKNKSSGKNSKKDAENIQNNKKNIKSESPLDNEEIVEWQKFVYNCEENNEKNESKEEIPESPLKIIEPGKMDFKKFFDYLENCSRKGAKNFEYYIMLFKDTEKGVESFAHMIYP